MPVALKALDTAMRTVENEGRVLGLEVAGKEEAQKGMREKQAALLLLLNTPMSIELVVPAATPPGWDDGDDGDD
jgi:hypothetical protein